MPCCSPIELLIDRVRRALELVSADCVVSSSRWRTKRRRWKETRSYTHTHAFNWRSLLLAARMEKGGNVHGALHNATTARLLRTPECWSPDSLQPINRRHLAKPSFHHHRLLALLGFHQKAVMLKFKLDIQNSSLVASGSCQLACGTSQDDGPESYRK